MIRSCSTALAITAVLLTALAVPQAIVAQTAYPARAIRIVIPFAAGSGSDIVARVIGEALAEQMGATVTPEAREGAGGVIGATAVAKAPADGYTLLSAATPMTVAPYMARTLPYDPARDFTALARISVIPMVLVTGANGPFRTFQDLVTHARDNPGKVNYATGGKGSPSHLEVELVGRALGLRLQDIPYRTFGQGLTDTIALQASFSMASLPLAQGHIKAGTLRALAVGAPTRVASVPDVPTFAEAMGKPGWEAMVWYGLAGPAGMPPEVVARLTAEIQKAMASAPVRERLARVGGLLAPMYGAEFSGLIGSESAKWSRIVREIGLTTE